MTTIYTLTELETNLKNKENELALLKQGWVVKSISDMSQEELKNYNTQLFLANSIEQVKKDIEEITNVK